METEEVDSCGTAFKVVVGETWPAAACHWMTAESANVNSTRQLVVFIWLSDKNFTDAFKDTASYLQRLYEKCPNDGGGP